MEGQNWDGHGGMELGLWRSRTGTDMEGWDWD